MGIPYDQDTMGRLSDFLSCVVAYGFAGNIKIIPLEIMYFSMNEFVVTNTVMKRK